MKHRLSQSGGFTLLELLMVVIIIGILAALALPGYFRTSERARAAEAITVMGQIRGSVQRYCMESNGTAPTGYGQLDMDNPTTIPQLSTRWSFTTFPTVGCSPPVFNMTVTRSSGPCSGSKVRMDTSLSPSPYLYTWSGPCA